ncbi:MAG: hypothetical protein JWN02_1975 [Acidobacteria bacterium]|nr:hypothetical protein [Acidobacteriota bacterium]
MNRLTSLAALALFAVLPLPAVSQTRHAGALSSFASDYQTVPVMGNTSGFGGASFQTYVAILNPTSSAFQVQASLYDTAGVKHDAVIALAAGELKTYPNFLDAAFHYTGGGAVVFKSDASVGGGHDNRFIVNAEVRTAGARYGTSIPALEFAGSSSRSFAGGITVDSNTRTNVGCFNQSDAANKVKATVLDNSGKQTIGSVELNLPAGGWGQTALTSIVSGGYIQFDPSDSAVCYAVVLDNGTNDGRFVSAAEYQP